MTDDSSETDFTRRTFLKTSGAVAGAGLLGAAGSGSAAGELGADLEVPLEFSNPRVLRAAHAWERDFRGRADRSVGLTDSGTDSRHPDVGPWNGVTATTRDGFETWCYAGETPPETELLDDDTLSGVSLPLELESHELDLPEGTGRIQYELTYDVDEAVVAAELLEDGEVVAAAVENGHTVTYDFVDEDCEYELAVGEIDASTTYEVTVRYLAYTANAPERVPVDDPMDGLAAGDEPALVGWHNDSVRYGSYRAPRDENSHGTHVSSIMTGTGQGSTIDPERTTIEDTPTVLLPGEVTSFEVTARADTGVFASAYGDAIELAIEGPDGRELATSGATQGTPEIAFRNNTTETPTVHDSGEATYTVYVRGIEGEPLPARVRAVAAGAFKHHDETDGDVTGGETTMHAGTAPGFSLVSVTDLGVGTRSVADHAEAFAERFNLRAINMSWGFVGGVPLGTVAGAGDDTVENVRALADAGILSVAAAGNDAQPASGNGPPAVANEAVSTVSTGPLDGIAAYSSGGIGGVDDESTEPYTKPDVTAIGGAVNDLDMAAMPGEAFDDDDPFEDADQHGSARTYAGKGGTSMASPSACGIAGLVMQAMEEEGPEGLDLPAPRELIAEAEPDERRAWVLKAKQALLATASTTAFNAAPYHGGKAPVYSHGERDPYEGFGRVNAGAAVDAVSRDLLADGELDDLQTVGLDVPRDEQAVAGYVRAAGEVDVSVEFSHYGGGNSGMARADPHVDLFVYDALAPEGVTADGGIDAPATGDPNVVESDQGIDGEASVSFDAGRDGGVYYVVAKLVSVPGVVNGYDVQAYLDLSLDVTEPPLPAFTADGDRDVDSALSLGGNSKRVRLTVSDLDADAEITDRYPEGWKFLGRFSDGIEREDGVVSFGTVDAADVESDEVTFTYFVEAPDALEESGPATFGPAEATLVGDGDEFRDDSAEFAGEDDVILAGVDL